MRRRTPARAMAINRQSKTVSETPLQPIQVAIPVEGEQPSMIAGGRPTDNRGLAELERLLGKLNSILGRERECGLQAPRSEISTLTQQKLQLLMELNRFTLDRRELDFLPEVREEIEATRENLMENARAIARRIDAIREIVEILSCAITEAESDGTYDMPIGGPQRVLNH